MHVLLALRKALSLGVGSLLFSICRYVAYYSYSNDVNFLQQCLASLYTFAKMGWLSTHPNQLQSSSARLYGAPEQTCKSFLSRYNELVCRYNEIKKKLLHVRSYAYAKVFYLVITSY